MRRALGAANDHDDTVQSGHSVKQMSMCEALMSILPVLFVLVVVTFLVLVYVYHIILSWDAAAGKAVEVAFFCVLFVLFSICYVRAALTEPGQIPDAAEWAYGDNSSSKHSRTESKRTGERRYCKWCDKYKPDRCHHCRVCKKCILKMDHHCPWLHNCIGFHNHKYFLLLIFYAALLSCFVSFSLLPRAMDISRGKEDSDARMVFFISGIALVSALGVALLLFLLFHVWMLLNGMSTIEFCEKSSSKTFRSKYNLGYCNNVARNLGPHWWLWLLPCSPPTGDGCHYEVDSESMAFAPKQWRATGEA